MKREDQTHLTDWVHLRLEDDLRGYAAFMRSRLGVRTNFELMARTKALEACAAGSTKLYVAVGLDVSNREDKKLLRAKKGPFGSTLVFKDGGEIARRFGAAASSVGAIVDTVVLADAAYYAGVEIVVGSRRRCDSFCTGTTSATRACRRSTELW